LANNPVEKSLAVTLSVPALARVIMLLGIEPAWVPLPKAMNRDRLLGHERMWTV